MAIHQPFRQIRGDRALLPRRPPRPIKAFLKSAQETIQSHASWPTSNTVSHKSAAYCAHFNLVQPIIVERELSVPKTVSTRPRYVRYVKSGHGSGGSAMSAFLLRADMLSIPRRVT